MTKRDDAPTPSTWDKRDDRYVAPADYEEWVKQGVDSDALGSDAVPRPGPDQEQFPGERPTPGDTSVTSQSESDKPSPE